MPDERLIFLDLLPAELREQPVCVESYRVQDFEEKVEDALTTLPERLTRFCVDPSEDVSKGVWFITDLLGALKRLRAEFIHEARQRLAEALQPLFRRRDMPAIDDAKLCEWIQRASALGVDLLLES